MFLLLYTSCCLLLAVIPASSFLSTGCSLLGAFPPSLVPLCCPLLGVTPPSIIPRSLAVPFSPLLRRVPSSLLAVHSSALSRRALFLPFNPPQAHREFLSVFPMMLHALAALSVAKTSFLCTRTINIVMWTMVHDGLFVFFEWDFFVIDIQEQATGFGNNPVRRGLHIFGCTAKELSCQR